MKSFTLAFVLYLTACLFLSTPLFAQDYERYHPTKNTLLDSKHLGYSKAISITLPREAAPDSNQKYPLILIFDQQNQRSFNYILQTIDYLTSNEQIPASVIVGITSSMDKRYVETQWQISDSAGVADKNEDFIFKELIPLLKSNYYAGDFLLLTGHSRYGFFTSALLAKHPELIDAVISISPFYQQANMNVLDSIEATFSESHLKQKSYYRFGMGNDFPEDYQAMQHLLANHQLTMLDAKGYLFPYADHNVTPGLMIGNALYDIFSYWSNIQNQYISNSELTATQMTGLMDSIQANYGAHIPFSLGVLNGKGWAFYGTEDYHQAIDAWEILLQSYPGFSEAYLFIAFARKELNLDFKTYVDKFRENLKHTKFYTAEEKKELLREYDTDIEELFKRE